jgi:hypothetical protein
MRVFCIAAVIAVLCGVTFAADQQTFKVSGRVLTSTGAPLRGKNLFIQIGHDESNGFSSGTYPMEEDGTFQCDLPAGRYLLVAGSLGGPGVNMTPLEDRGFAAVTVGRADVASVVIRTHPLLRVRGRVRFEGEMANAIRPGINVFSSPALDGLGVGGTEPSSPVAPDGSFELLVAAGPVVIRNGYSPRADSMWWPGPVLLDGQDITDVPTDFSKTHGELELVFTQRPIGVFGIVTEESTQLPAESASVVVFSAEPTQRQPWANASKLIDADDDGRFWSTLSPGRYLAVAFPAATFSGVAEAMRAVATFERLATPFTIDPERRGARVHLTLLRPPILPRQHRVM